jgi:hypothetical protein
MLIVEEKLGRCEWRKRGKKEVDTSAGGREVAATCGVHS